MLEFKDNIGEKGCASMRSGSCQIISDLYMSLMIEGQKNLFNKEVFILYRSPLIPTTTLQNTTAFPIGQFYATEYNRV
jgi:hypothetical protein